MNNITRRHVVGILCVTKTEKRELKALM